MKLDVKACGLAFAIVWSLGLLCLTWWLIAWEGSTGDPTFIGRVYRGYNVSPVGSLIGFVWAFGDGLVGGLVFALLYNWLRGGAREEAGAS